MRSKRYREIVKNIDRDKYYPLEEAVDLVKKCANAKFNETIEIAVSLNIDEKKKEVVRGNVRLPHGTGRTPRIVVFTKGEKEKEARDAGADYVGGEDLIEKVLKGWCEFDIAISTPDMMKEVSKLGKILGPKGLLPNPKSGTVTFELEKTIKEFKSGMIEYKSDQTGTIHSIVGKASFENKQLSENIKEFIKSVSKLKTSKDLIKKVTISSTMGPGIKIDHKELLKEKEIE